jgi:hypothetical protein
MIWNMRSSNLLLALAVASALTSPAIALAASESSRKKDLEKKEIYARLGVEEYFLLELKRRTPRASEPT